MKRLIYLFIINSIVPSLSIGATIQYRLTVDPSNPTIVTASVNTADLGVFSLVKPRTLPSSGTAQKSDIKCTKKTYEEFKVEYGKEVQCENLSWTINFHQLGKLDTNVSKQNNLYSSNGWWVLFEWDNIPRFKNQTDIEICTNQINDKFQNVCRELASPDDPPLIMAWGNITEQKNEANVQFNLYTDNNFDVMNYQNWSQLFSQYDYLQQLLFSKGTEKKEIDLIWVGIDAKIGSMGGAAGKQAYVSNYVVENNQVSQKSFVRLHWVSGHEIFHMLTPFAYPTWISESLAHYYGFKSLRFADIKSETPIEMWEKNKNRMPHATSGLYEAHDKVVNKQDMSYYGLFYVKGAAFWYELDNELTKKGASLDSYLATLSGAEQSSGQFNSNFQVVIEKIIGKNKYDKLVSDYL